MDSQVSVLHLLSVIHGKYKYGAGPQIKYKDGVGP